MKILELFSGYGTASFALKRLGINYEIVGYSDIDKYANQCFKQNHCPDDVNDKLRLGDVKLINPNDLEDFDLLTGGFPCQSFSVAGKGLGELDPRGTLFYEIIRIADVKKPKYMLLENVKGLTNKNHKITFEKILSEIERIGYNVYYKVLNTKDYGIPQNRERVWFVGFRKDIDKGLFKFPEKEELKIFIKDILEPSVDEKYYLSPLLQERFLNYLEEKNKNNCLYQPYNKAITEYVSFTLGTTCGMSTGSSSQIVAMRSYPRTGTKEEDGERTQNFEPQKEPISNTISSVQKDNLIYSKKGFDRKSLKESEISPTLVKFMGTGGNNVPMVQGIANCLKVGGRVTKPKYYYEKKNDNFAVSQKQLRRLTPKECFRLQGFLNDEIDLSNLSDTQCYKMAGNGQSVNVVTKIFKEMFK